MNNLRAAIDELRQSKSARDRVVDRLRAPGGASYSVREIATYLGTPQPVRSSELLRRKGFPSERCAIR